VTARHRRRRDPLAAGTAGFGFVLIITALLYAAARCAGA
jgi:hypothetical protein